MMLTSAVGLNKSNLCKTFHIFNYIRKLSANFPRYDSREWKISEKYHIRPLSSSGNYSPRDVKCVTSEEVRRDFMSYLPCIIDELTHQSPYAADMPMIMGNYAKALEYNAKLEKKCCGPGLVAAYKTFESLPNLNTENIRLANMLGWCVEMIRTSFAIEDDIEDGSEFRSGKRCWHKQEGIDDQAIFDVKLVEDGFRFILKRHFLGHPIYVVATELLQEMIFKRRLARSLEHLCRINQNRNFDLFTMKTFITLVKYKSFYPNFKIPFDLAIQFIGKPAELYNNQADLVLQKMAEFTYIENDMLDCFGDSATYTREKNDITNGKCTWLVTTALERGTSSQQQLLKENYGRMDFGCEETIRNLYQELNLMDLYLTYREESYNYLNGYIQNMKDDRLQQFLLSLLTQVYSLNANLFSRSAN